jgi:Family of unknown function (DUF5760)
MEEAYVNMVKKWVELDNMIENNKIRMKEATDERKQLEAEILDYVESNNLQELQINISDGFINFHTAKVPQAMSIKFLKDNLAKYFEENENKEMMDADSIIKYLLQNRGTKQHLSMKRHISS